MEGLDEEGGEKKGKVRWNWSGQEWNEAREQKQVRAARTLHGFNNVPMPNQT